VVRKRERGKREGLLSKKKHGRGRGKEKGNDVWQHQCPRGKVKKKRPE